EPRARSWSSFVIRRGPGRGCAAVLAARVLEPLVDPLTDVVEHLFFAYVVEQIVKMPFVELQGLVLRSGGLMKELAAVADGRLVAGPVHDQDRERDRRELL